MVMMLQMAQFMYYKVFYAFFRCFYQFHIQGEIPLFRQAPPPGFHLFDPKPGPDKTFLLKQGAPFINVFYESFLCLLPIPVFQEGFYSFRLWLIYAGNYKTVSGEFYLIQSTRRNI